MILTLAAVTAGLATTAIVFTIVLVALIVLALRAIDGESGSTGSDDPGSDGGGGGSLLPRPRPDRGGDPAWWPEFERELNRYAAWRDADRSETGARASSGPSACPTPSARSVAGSATTSAG